jgi:hypothetical protein
MSESILSEIRGAVARGYCSPKNENKILDPELCIAITDEIIKLKYFETKKKIEEKKIKVRKENLPKRAIDWNINL